MLAGMTLVINVFMHDFWNVYEGLTQQHETQNFIKNLAIMAGLLTLTAGLGGSILIAGQHSERTVKSNLTTTLRYRHQPPLAVGPASGWRD